MPALDSSLGCEPFWNGSWVPFDSEPQRHVFDYDDDRWWLELNLNTWKLVWFLSRLLQSTVETVANVSRRKIRVEWKLLLLREIENDKSSCGFNCCFEEVDFNSFGLIHENIAVQYMHKLMSNQRSTKTRKYKANNTFPVQVGLKLDHTLTPIIAHWHIEIDIRGNHFTAGHSVLR